MTSRICFYFLEKRRLVSFALKMVINKFKIETEKLSSCLQDGFLPLSCQLITHFFKNSFLIHRTLKNYENFGIQIHSKEDFRALLDPNSRYPEIIRNLQEHIIKQTFCGSSDSDSILSDQEVFAYHVGENLYILQFFTLYKLA